MRVRIKRYLVKMSDENLHSLKAHVLQPPAFNGLITYLPPQQKHFAQKNRLPDSINIHPKAMSNCEVMDECPGGLLREEENADEDFFLFFLSLLLHPL